MVKEGKTEDKAPAGAPAPEKKADGKGIDLEKIANMVKEGKVDQSSTKESSDSKTTADLEAGDSKVCSRCEKVKPVEDFFDASLKGGDGGYGRICTTCKGPKASSKKRRSRKRSSTRTKVSADGSREGATYLNCPYSDKEECKKLGGRWDPFRKKWYVPSGVEISRFSKWL